MPTFNVDWIEVFSAESAPRLRWMLEDHLDTLQVPYTTLQTHLAMNDGIIVAMLHFTRTEIDEDEEEV